MTARLSGARSALAAKLRGRPAPPAQPDPADARGVGLCNDLGMTEPQPTTPLDRPTSPALAAWMKQGWLESEVPAGVLEIASESARRRAQLAARFPGEALVIPTGGAKVRSNDTDYEFRANSGFAYLTGDLDPDSVLVMLPAEGGHQATLYRRERLPRSETTESFENRQHGEFWVGRRRSLGETAEQVGIACADLGELPEALRRAATGAVRVLRGVDAGVDAAVPAPPQVDVDRALGQTLDEMRLIKDGWELEQIQDAVDATVRGFVDVVRRLPLAVETGERMVEGLFSTRARVDGNGNGYSVIAAAGAHATTLHWTRNDGPVKEGDLLLLDAGVENRWLYSADVTRTIPVSGRFSPAQRRVYDLVWRAHQAALAAVRPGARFLEYHEAADRVLAGGLHEWGLLPVPAEESLRDDSGLHRRWTLHGAGHMLGLDVHDCVRAPRETNRFGVLREGMVLTVEPGLYFQADDLLVPEELRGIGVRIEDDVVVTAAGCHILSAALPTQADEVEAWMASLSGDWDQVR